MQLKSCPYILQHFSERSLHPGALSKSKPRYCFSITFRLVHPLRYSTSTPCFSSKLYYLPSYILTEAPGQELHLRWGQLEQSAFHMVLGPLSFRSHWHFLVLAILQDYSISLTQNHTGSNWYGLPALGIVTLPATRTSRNNWASFGSYWWCLFVGCGLISDCFSITRRRRVLSLLSFLPVPLLCRPSGDWPL